MRGRSKKGKNKSDKITPGEFFSIEIKVLRSEEHTSELQSH